VKHLAGSKSFATPQLSREPLVNRHHIPQDTAGQANNRRASSRDQGGKALDNPGCECSYLLIHDKRPQGIHHWRQPRAEAMADCASLPAPRSLWPALALKRIISSKFILALSSVRNATLVFGVLSFQPTPRSQSCEKSQKGRGSRQPARADFGGRKRDLTTVLKGTDCVFALTVLFSPWGLRRMRWLVVLCVMLGLCVPHSDFAED